MPRTYIAESPNPTQFINKHERITPLSLLALISIMAFAFCYYLRYICCRNRNNSSRVTASTVICTSNDEKLNCKILASLPAFGYSDPSDEKGESECAICLTEFTKDELLRELPNCRHVFHMECVDMWFGSHSSCPLCRVVVEYFDSV